MNLAQCVSDFSSEYGLIFSLFLAGLIGGITHCSGMCAPFVLAQSGTYQGETRLARLKATLLLPYHFGRMSTYVMLAVIFQSVLNLAFLFSEIKIVLSSILLLSAALIFAVNIFPAVAGSLPWMSRISLPVSFRRLQTLAMPLIKEPTSLKRYALGVLLGFMPCGMVIAAIMAASTAPTPFEAALAMSAFSLGTVPALILVSAGGQALQLKFPKTKLWIKGTAGAFSVVWLCVLAGMMMV